MFQSGIGGVSVSSMKVVSIQAAHGCKISFAVLMVEWYEDEPHKDEYTWGEIQNCMLDLLDRLLIL